HEMFPNIMRVIDLLRQRRSPTEACRDTMVTWHSVKRYCDKDEDLKGMLIDAQQEGFDNLADLLRTLDRDPFYRQSDPAILEEMMDNIKWDLARKNPAGYGDKQTVDVNIRADSVIL